MVLVQILILIGFISCGVWLLNSLFITALKQEGKDAYYYYHNVEGKFSEIKKHNLFTRFKSLMS